MRGPSPLAQQESPFASGLPTGNEAIAGVWTDVAHFVQGVWIEVLVAAVALLMYLWLEHKKRAYNQDRHSPKVIDSPTRRQTTGRAGKNLQDSDATRHMHSFRKGDEGQQVQKFVISLLQRSQQSNPTALLNQYQELVKACGSNIRLHIPDDQNARSMFVALINCGVAQATEFSKQGAGSKVRRCTSGFLADMRSMNFSRSVDFYSAVLKIFTTNDLFQEGLWLHESMTEDGLVASSPMLISLLNISVTCGESAKALSFFESIAESTSPSLRTVMTVLRVHSTNKDWQGAAKLLDRMECLGTSPDNLILNHVLGLCVSVGEVDGAERLLQRWRNISDVISCNILLKGCAQQGDLVRAEVALGSMSKQGPEPNLISYNTVMDCAVRSMQVLSNERPAQGHGGASRAAGNSHHGPSFAAIARRPWELLDQLILQGLEPDRYTCSTLVKGMHVAGCTVSDIDRAVELLNRIGATALQAQSTATNSGGAARCNERLLEVLFNTLLDACITVRDLDRMTDIFVMMQQFKVGVSAVTHGTLIKAFGQAGRLVRCHEIWEDMRVARIYPTIVTYGCYIDACIRNDDTERAEGVFESMMDTPRGVRPNAVIYTSLIRGFANSRQPKKALEFYRRMLQEGIQATSVTFNSVLDVVARQLSEPSVLQEVIDDMCKANITPDVVTYSILMKASCASGNVQNALSLFRQIQGRGLVFDQVSFNTLLLSCSKADQIQDAEDIFGEMRRCGLAPSHVTTSIMVKMYGKAKMLDKAIALSELLETEYGQKPNIYVYTCLIQACVQNKQVRRSWEIFNKMANSGVEPDAITYGTVIHGCVYLNKFSYAMSLVRHAYKQTAPAGAEETPFVSASPLKQIVPLQPEVLQMLSSALQRKDQSALATELADIMLKHAHAPNEAKAHWNRSSRRGRTGNADY